MNANVETGPTAAANPIRAADGGGVQNIGSTVIGNIAGSAHGDVHQEFQMRSEPGQAAATVAELAAGLRALRGELAQARETGEVTLSETDGADVDRALEEAEHEATVPNPDRGRLGRRIRDLREILGGTAAMAKSVAALVGVFEAIRF
jgi:hypothetical protein